MSRVSVQYERRERLGYNVDYAKPRAISKVLVTPFWKRFKTEERFGLLIFAGGLIWAVKVETVDWKNIVHLLLTPGPLELSAIGILIWLHAKWRRSVRVD